MGKDKKTPVTIDGVEHDFDEMTPEQQVLFNHCVDLDRKINTAKFNLDQLTVGKNAFFTMLQQSLSSKQQEAA